MTKLNSYIEHTLLKPTATVDDIITLCEEAKKYKFYGICVNSCYVYLAVNQLNDSSIKVIATIGFPLGASSTKAKIEEARAAIKQGADEIDMVINLGFLKSDLIKSVSEEIRIIKKTIGRRQLKVIIETCVLDNAEIVMACEIARLAGADFIKTSTGFAKKGALLKDVRLIRKKVNNKMGIKASGGIKTVKQAIALINAGATRIGTSKGVELVKNRKNTKK